MQIRMMNKADMDVRAEKMAQMFKGGQAMARIGEAFGLTRSRVQQILAAQGLTWRDGGPGLAHAEKEALRAEKAALRRAAREDALLKKHAREEAKLRAWSDRVLGVSLDEARDLCQTPDSPGLRRGHPSPGDSLPCKKYVVGWAKAVVKYGGYLNFRDWWQVWQDSGHFSAVTGPDAGWCLIKKEYTQPWSVANAQVVLHGAWSKAGGPRAPKAVRVGARVRRDGCRIYQSRA